ncbi:MAG: RHS repeat-associated core domain-containing protein [Bacilli bacterium]|nr:RHS repeat-associated core domain-containing protein [Bacilli bacterium]
MIQVPQTMTLVPFGDERITARLDVGSFGQNSFFEIPLVGDFAGLGFPISVAVPFSSSDGIPRIQGLSFYFEIVPGGSSLTLKRAGVPDLAFLPQGGGEYLCVSTGERIQMLTDSSEAVLGYRMALEEGTGLLFDADGALSEITLRSGIQLAVETMVIENLPALVLRTTDSEDYPYESFAMRYNTATGKIVDGKVVRMKPQYQSLETHTVFMDVIGGTPILSVIAGEEGNPSFRRDYSITASASLVSFAYQDSVGDLAFTIQAILGTSWAKARFYYSSAQQAEVEISRSTPNLARCVDTGGRQTYFGLRQVGAFKCVVGEIGPHGECFCRGFDQEGRLCEVSDAFCASYDGRDSRDALGGCDFGDGGWVLSGTAAVADPPEAVAAVAALSGWSWLRVGPNGSAFLTRTLELLPLEPAMLVFVGYGSPVSATVYVGFAQGGQQTIQYARETPADCLAPSAIPLVFEKKTSYLTVAFSGAESIRWLGAAQVIRGASLSKADGYVGWHPTVTSVAGRDGFLCLDSKARPVCRGGQHGSDLIAYFGEGTLIKSRTAPSQVSTAITYKTSPGDGTVFNPALFIYPAETTVAEIKTSMTIDDATRKENSRTEGGIETNYEYSDTGMPTSSIFRMQSGPRAIETKADAKGRPTRIRWELSGASGGANLATHNGFGIATLSDPASVQTAFSYDALGRRTSASCGGESNRAYGYEPGWAGRATSEGIGSAIYAVSYSTDWCGDYPSGLQLAETGRPTQTWVIARDGPDSPMGEYLNSGAWSREGYADPESAEFLEVWRCAGSRYLLTKSSRGGTSLSTPCHGERGLGFVPASSDVHRGDPKSLSLCLTADGGWRATRIWRYGDDARLCSLADTYPQEDPVPTQFPPNSDHPCAKMKGTAYAAAAGGTVPLAVLLGYRGSSVGLVELSKNGSPVGSITEVSNPSDPDCGYLVFRPTNGGNIRIGKPRNGWNHLAFCLSSGYWVACLNGAATSCGISTPWFLSGTTFTVAIGNAISGANVGILAIGNKVLTTETATALSLCSEDAFGPVSVRRFGTSFPEFRSFSALHLCGSKHSGGSDPVAIPLDGTLASSGGFGPSSFTLLPGIGGTSASGLPKALYPSLFAYDEKLKSLAYRAYGQRLSYPFAGGSAGTVVVRFSLDSGHPDTVRRQVFEISSGGNIGAYVLGSTLFVSAGGQTMLSAGVSIPGAHVLALTFTHTAVPDPYAEFPYDVQAAMILDGGTPQQQTAHVQSNIGPNAAIHLGTNAGGSFPSRGKICGLELYSDHMSAQSLAGFLESSSGHCRECWNDVQGRPSVSAFSRAGNAWLKNEFAYQEDTGGNPTRLLTQEKIRVGTSIWKTISYGRDSSGLLSSWEGQTVARDAMGFVTAAIGGSASYNASGDIVSKDGSDYTYAPSGFPHRLLSAVNPQTGKGTSFAYPSTGHKGYPNSVERIGTGAGPILLSYNGDLLLSAIAGNQGCRYAYDPDGFLSVAYDAAGTVLHRYAFRDGRLRIDSVPGEYDLVYAYGPDGNPCFLSEARADGTVIDYSIACDATGRILRLDRLDQNGAYAEYSYDAWGKCSLVSDGTGGMGARNKLRYKSYLYDEWLGAYCLGKRHYDPEIGRFWEPDSPDYLDPSSAGGLNPYVYCNNDPITYSDHTGRFPLIMALILAGAAIGAASYVVSEGISYGLTGEWSWSWGQFAGCVIGGALGGAFSGFGAGAFVAGFVTGFSSTAIGMSLQNGFEGNNYSGGEIFLTSFSVGIMSGLLSKAMDFLPVYGLNAGRNSFAAITKASITKSLRGTISSVSLKTASKALLYNAFSSIGTTLWSGFADASNYYYRTQKWWLISLENGWL